MPYSVLKITDGTPAGTVNLMSIMSGFHVKSWKPAIAQYKDSGVWLDNVMAHGRKLKMRRYMNVTESIELMSVGCDIDSLIEDIQDLRRLLERAADYWEYDHITAPIYIEAKTLYETNARYAVIYAGSVPEDAELADPTFVSHLIADGITLSLEHALWQSTVPGSGDCVEVSSERTINGTYVREIDELISEDDCVVTMNAMTISLNSVNEIFYYTSGPYVLTLNGLRFRNVAIPPGAIITSAYVTFVSSGNYVNEVDVSIHGEANATPLQYSTYADFAARVPTTASVTWHIVAAWTLNSAYDSPSLIAIIQEIIGLPGWVEGGNIGLTFNTMAVHDGNGRNVNSIDGAVAPVLHVTYTADVDFGRAATCDAEVFVANKHNLAQLTDIYTYDASTGLYSSNLIDSAKPVKLFPDPIGDGDCLYIGIRDSVTNHGPFCSAVYDIYGWLVTTGAVVFASQYWDGGAWAPLSIKLDIASKPFSYGGYGMDSHHWLQPADWASTTVNGVAGLWIRWILVSGEANVAVVPSQQLRDIYTITVPYVDMASSQIGGDVQALLRAYMCNVSGDGGLGYILSPNRVILAVRGLTRGSNFTPYINLSSEQNPTGIILYPGANTAIANGNQYPTGHVYVYTAPAGAQALASRVAVYLSTTALASEYHGKFRAFLIADPSSSEFYARLSVQGFMLGGWVNTYSTESVPVPSHGVSITDLGEINTPPFFASGTQQVFRLSVDVGSTTGGGTLVMYYLWLVPIDEYVADLLEVNSGNAVLYRDFGIDVDSVSDLRHDTVAFMRYLLITNPPFASWRAISKAFELRPNLACRLFAFCMHDAGSGNFEYEYTAAHRLQLYKAQRYLSLRGSR